MLRLLLAAALASAWPAPAVAAAASAVRAAPAAGVPSIAAPMPAPSSAGSLPSLGAPSLLAPPLAAVALGAAPAAAVAASAIVSVVPIAAPSAHRRLSSAAEAVVQAGDSASPASAEYSASASESQFRLLLGETVARPRAVAYADGPAAPRPSGLTPASAPAGKPHDPEKAARVRGMFAGTAAMKIGMEAVKLSIPLLALQTMGGATIVAGLVVADCVAQSLFAGAAGSLLDRLPAPKVLGGALVTQAVVVASIVALGAAGMLTPWTLFPLYILFGGTSAITETSRHSIAPLILGRNEEELSRYNARLHIFYEVSGVVGALSTGALIALSSPLWSLALQPPAYLLGAWIFWRVKLAPDGASTALAASTRALASLRERIAEYFSNIKVGAALILKDERMRWVAAAFVLPQIVHRILEGLVIPIYAKRVLESPGSSGILMTASNLGELLGAVLLLRFASKVRAPLWVKLCAATILMCWVLAFTHALPAAFIAILAMSLTWSSSDLSLRSEIQSSLGDGDQPRAASFLYSSLILGTGLVSLLLGLLIDAAAMTPALYGIFALYTAVAAVVFFAGRRLAAPKT
ncbi:MAG: hypothetical protein A2V88_00585 [Elusimicrobia bacterium RBG_16_66_12]|nr:MAG: hypothetical protein A2V88_00585 [Elusimicrobia bacterium RBG_16_66_12]